MLAYLILFCCICILLLIIAFFVALRQGNRMPGVEDVEISGED
jgi:hypothetical protein